MVFIPEIERASEIFSCAVSVSSKLKSWKINPNFLRLKADSFFPRNSVISFPSTIICPLVTESIVDMQF